MRDAQGHFQVFFHNTHCPLFQHGLSYLQRIMYCQGVWSYIVGAISTPTFVCVPLVTIWAGVFPIVLSWWAALGLTAYYVATTLVSRCSSLAASTAAFLCCLCACPRAIF